jgi:hypothetical protein
MNRYLASALASAALIALLSPTQPPFKTLPSSIEQKGQGVLDAVKAATDAMGSVVDEQTAVSARSKVAESEIRIKQFDEKKESWTAEEKKWARDVYALKLLIQKGELDVTHDRLLRANEKLYGLVGDVEKFRKYRETQLARTRTMALEIQKACKAYFISTEEYPKKLNELIVADGGKPYLDGGMKAILDPWGNEFKLILEEDAQSGEIIPVIATKNPYGEAKEEIRWPAKTN